jgi:hypothetical protein
VVPDNVGLIILDRGAPLVLCNVQTEADDKGESHDYPGHK